MWVLYICIVLLRLRTFSFQKVYYHESTIVRANKTPRISDRRKRPKFSHPNQLHPDSSHAALFSSLPEGYIFYYKGKSYRVVFKCSHEQAYFAIPCSAIGESDITNNKGFTSFAAIYIEDIDDLTEVAHANARSWITSQRKKGPPRRKRLVFYLFSMYRSAHIQFHSKVVSCLIHACSQVTRVCVRERVNGMLCFVHKKIACEYHVT